jgi:hypothetical protein
VYSGIVLLDVTNFTATVLFGLNPFALMTMLNPGSAGPQVGDTSSFGSAKTVKSIILPRPKIPKTNDVEINPNLSKRYIPSNYYTAC